MYLVSLSFLLWGSPMFSYYGSKSKIVGCYPPPKHGKIIEPFAGSTRYSLKYFDREVLLVDKYEIIIRIWKWLQKASEQDIMSLPVLKKGETVDMFNYDCEEQKWLLGMLITASPSQPKNTPSNWKIIERPNTINFKKNFIASNLYKIKHWEVRLDDYRNLENEKATWFIDPPYQFGGEWYVENNKNIDYNQLADWCKGRNGQAIVCENSKANWLPFRQMAVMTGSKYKTVEMIWSNQQTNYDWEQLSFEGLSA